MVDTWHDLIKRIHQAPHRAVVVVTGGGASAIAGLLSIPGGSKTLLEAVVPYSEAALSDWLGMPPEQFCVEETALAMAAMAFQRACQLTPVPQAELADRTAVQNRSRAPTGLAVGVSCTASLVSDRPKKGEHRCHVGVHSASGTSAYSLVMEKGARDRAGEEQVVGHLILQALAQTAGLGDLPVLELQGGESVAQEHVGAAPLLAELLEGRRGVVWSLPDASAGHRPPDGAVLHQARRTSLHATIPIPLSAPAGVLCGAFDPLHHGHERLRAVAERIVQGPVYYELSIRNVDKPPLDYLTVARRCAQFQNIPLALTSAPTFAEKARVLPGVVFVVGVDTAERIIAPRYYRGGDMESALRQIRDAGCRFLVAGRTVRDRFTTLGDLPIPAEFAELFTAVPPDQFREEISSTELRKPS
jgi:hypothetical protein